MKPGGEETPFASSQLIASTDKMREGETITYTLTVRYAGPETPQQIAVTFPVPDPAMLVSAFPPMAFNDEYRRELTWEGQVKPDQDLVFTITLVTVPDSASSRSLFANAGIFWRPQGREWEAESHWLQSETEIHSRLAPILFVLPGGYGIGKAELVLLGYLVLGALLVLLVPTLIMRREKQRRTAQAEETKAAEKVKKTFLQALAFAFVCLVGMAHLMGSVVLEDIRRHVSYQKNTCTVLDKRIVLEEGSSSSSKGTRSTTDYNKPLVAVRYQAGGREITTVGMPKPSAPLSAADKFALRQLARYERGKSYPCWYDPQEPTTFVLARGISWGWYLLGAIPMLILYFLGRFFLRSLGR